MLVDLYDAFLAAITDERELDAPLASLLWAGGLRSVSLVHGNFEFGKDLVAQCREPGYEPVQYCIQSKRGDIDKTCWDREVRPQCEMMATTKIGSPDYDHQLKRKIVVVFTGTFKGQTAISAKEYSAAMQERWGIEVEFWHRRVLAEKFEAHYTSLFRAFRTEPTRFFTELGEVLGFASKCQEGDFTWKDLERLTSRWSNPESQNGHLLAIQEIFWLRQLLKQKRLGYHANLVCQGLARVLAVRFEQSDREGLEFGAEIYKKLILQDCDDFLEWYEAVETKYQRRALVGAEPGQTFSTTVRLHHFLELTSLALILEAESKLRVDRIRSFYVTALTTQIARAPVSDDSATTVFLFSLGQILLGMDPTPWLEDVAVWICDRNQDLGLSPPRSRPSDVVYRLGIPMIEIKEVHQRRESFILSSLLDTASFLGNSHLYNSILNEANAVGLVPSCNSPILSSKENQFLIGKHGVNQAHGGNYSETWKGEDGWKNAGHHRSACGKPGFEEAGYPWIGLAVSLLLRDRFWPGTNSRMFQASMAGKQNSMEINDRE